MLLPYLMLLVRPCGRGFAGRAGVNRPEKTARPGAAPAEQGPCLLRGARAAAGHLCEVPVFNNGGLAQWALARLAVGGAFPVAGESTANAQPQFQLLPTCAT